MENQLKQVKCDILILGGGPAGLCAAIYAARGQAHTVLVEKYAAGGQINQTLSIENYPGVMATSGAELSNIMREQAILAGAELIYAYPTRLSLLGTPKSVVAGDTEYLAKVVILCTGASPRKLNLLKEAELTGQGVSYCATCDGAFFRKKAVAVVGGGNTAVQDALYLKDICSEVTLIHRRGEFRAFPEQIKQLEASGVKLALFTVVTELIGEPLSALQLKNTATGEISTLAVEGLFVAAGRTPDTEGFPLQILNEDGFIETDDQMHTKVDGVLAAGDVRQKPLRQVVTAVADGAVAAETALKSLRT